ncbi:acyltransferase, partial [Helicobacter cinaedi]
CIVGAGSVILPSSKGLSEGVSVGALSLVVRPTKPFGIYFGNPAKRILERSKNILTLEKEFLKSLKSEFLTGGGAVTLPFINPLISFARLSTHLQSPYVLKGAA